MNWHLYATCLPSFLQVGDLLNSIINKLDNPDKVIQKYKNAKSYLEWNTLYLSLVADWLAAYLGRESPEWILLHCHQVLNLQG